jgi:putative phosphoesterase
MRLGLIADVHADPRALERALRHLDTLGVAHILCAGDVVGYGGQPDAAVTLLRDRSVLCIRGNHDRWALERRQVLGARGWKAAVFEDATWEFLEALPPSDQRTWDGRIVAVHHGSPGNDTEYVSPYKTFPASVEQFWDEQADRVLILGHTHVPMIVRDPRGTIVNPGSIVGVPGIPTSYSHATLDLDDLSVRVFDVRTGREIRRDPVFVDDE